MSQNEITAFQKRNELVIPDASPLIYLAKMDLLDLLPAMYERILITDVVWMEATRHADKFEDAARTLKWGKNLQETMPDRFIIAETLIGIGIGASIEKNQNFRYRNAGENSIMEWATNAADDPNLKITHPEILYENGVVPRLVAALEVPVTTLNTWAFIQDAMNAGHPISVEKILKMLAEKKIHFNLERSVQHNEAALKELSQSKEQPQAKQPKIGFKDDTALEKL